MQISPSSCTAKATTLRTGTRSSYQNNRIRMDAVSVRSVEVSNVKGTILSCHLHAAAFADNIDRIASSFLFFFFLCTSLIGISLCTTLMRPSLSVRSAELYTSSIPSRSTWFRCSHAGGATESFACSGVHTRSARASDCSWASVLYQLDDGLSFGGS